MSSPKCILLVLVITLGSAGCGSLLLRGDSNNNSEQQPPAVHEFQNAAEALAEGTRLLDQGETQRAIEVLNKAVELDPNLAEGYFKLGIAYSLVELEGHAISVEPAPTPEGKGKKPAEVKLNSEIAFEKAVEAYKKMIEANEKDDAAYFYLGLSYNKLNEDEDAAKALREAVKLKPDDAEYQTELGAILIKLAKYPEAVAALKKALELDPTNSKTEDLLEKAEAGRKRVEYVSLPKDDKKPGRDANANSNAQAEDEDKPASDRPPAARSTPAATPVPRRSPNERQ